MRDIQPPGIFASNRAVVTPNYAVMPPRGILPSRLPGFFKTSIHIQAAPALGAKFAQILLDIQPGGGAEMQRAGLQHFFYVVEGRLEIRTDKGKFALVAEDYAYIGIEDGFALHNPGDTLAKVIWIKKPYVALPGVAAPASFSRRRSEVEKRYRHTEGRYWQYLIEDEDLAFDFDMNILSFQPGTYFPFVETHIMEHGLYMLSGQGMYLLGRDWHECWKHDFIYMAPYCPQFFYATGWEEATYLLYKDMNRDIDFA